MANSFVDLQQARHEADYNLRKKFSRGEAKVMIGQAEQAAADWREIRKDDVTDRIERPSIFIGKRR